MIHHQDVPHPTPTQIRLNNIVTCLTLTANTVQILATTLETPFLEAISNTTQSLLKHVQTIKQNKNICTELLEQAYKLLNAVLMVHVKSDTSGELPPSVLHHIGKFTETLHKIHTFVEAQQNGSKVKNFFRQGEMSTLLKDCEAGLQQGFVFFQVEMLNIMNIMHEDAENRHKEVLNMIEALSDTTSSDGASSISRVYSGSHNRFLSSNSISMLPSEPKIFHGQQSEISEILHLFGQGTPRIAILGAGGMGKTTLARAIVHHGETTGRYEQHRFFIACDSAATQIELAALIGAHLGLKPGKDLTRPVIQHFSTGPQSVEHLALVPSKPLEQDAAWKTFIDIADNTHNPEEVDKVLALTDNMPLAINLLAHLVDSEGCTSVLSRWEEEKTLLMLDGYDRSSNLDLSISLSLSSPRLDSFPHSKDLLSLLSMLPDGLSDAELVQAKLPIDNILGCKAALIRTTLAYNDEHNRLKALVPIREYIWKIKPPGNQLIQPLLHHFKELLELFVEYHGTESSSATAARISSNYSNIQSILWNGAEQGHADLVNTIYCACDLNDFSLLIGQGPISFTAHIPSIFPQPRDHHLEAYYMLSLVNSLGYSSTSVTETQVSEALEHFKYFDDPDLKSLSTQNTKMQSHALTSLAWINWSHGDYFTTQVHTNEIKRLARNLADLHSDYQQSILLCSRARDLLALCGMSGGHLDHAIMTNLAEIHKFKSEYVEARNIHFRILQETSVTQDFYAYGIALLNVAEIDVAIGSPMEDVQSVYEKARDIFSTRSLMTEVTFWTTVFLVHSVQQREKLGINKALQFLGDVFLAQDDEHTAINLFTVVLQGFTYMDVITVEQNVCSDSEIFPKGMVTY
ncbi:hypothetical protein B0H13DRAFT_1867585 [Mycena leptocephala]|nr:hypothetical protein B0H13DRAFT_1867585 [Mycena leptocephala]